jgi:hypothetical protein
MNDPSLIAAFTQSHSHQLGQRHKLGQNPSGGQVGRLLLRSLATGVQRGIKGLDKRILDFAAGQCLSHLGQLNIGEVFKSRLCLSSYISKMTDDSPSWFTARVHLDDSPSWFISGVHSSGFTPTVHSHGYAAKLNLLLLRAPNRLTSSDPALVVHGMFTGSTPRLSRALNPLNRHWTWAAASTLTSDLVLHKTTAPGRPDIRRSPDGARVGEVGVEGRELMEGRWCWIVLDSATREAFNWANIGRYGKALPGIGVAARGFSWALRADVSFLEG